VALILIVLLSIAVPTFLAVRSSGRNRAAQANLNTALQAAQRLYISTASYSNVTASALQQAEPSLTYIEAGGCGQQVCNSSAPNDIVVLTTPYGNPQAVELAAWSSSGTCWFLLSLQDSWPSDPMGSYTDPAPTTAGTYYGKLAMSSSKSCNITGRNVGVNGGGWASTFSAAQG
jgi:type II secretory pathway pseudopilin PulG